MLLHLLKQIDCVQLIVNYCQTIYTRLLMMPGFFNRSIINLAFSKETTEFLSSKLLTEPILKATYAEVLRVRIDEDTTRSSPLVVAVY